MTIDVLLDRLDGVQRVGEGQWKARCPAHEDNDPSFGVKVTPDGKILIHCFAGCDKLSILHAAGLNMADLFPDSHDHHVRPLYMATQEKKRREKREAGLGRERMILAMAKQDRKSGKKLSPAELERERLAFRRVNGIS